MKSLLTIVFLLVGCGKIASTEHKIKAEGEAEIRHVVDIRLDICEDLPLEDKVECIRDVLAILEAALKMDQDLDIEVEDQDQ